MRDCDEVTKLKWRLIHGHVCVLIPTSLLAQLHGLRTNIQATTTAQVNAIAPDGTTTSRKSGTTSTTLRDKATAKSDHSGQFFIADDNRVPGL